MREIVLDTETTGFDPFQGDRIVEIGAVELLTVKFADQNFQRPIGVLTREFTTSALASIDRSAGAEHQPVGIHRVTRGLHR